MQVHRILAIPVQYHVQMSQSSCMLTAALHATGGKWKSDEALALLLSDIFTFAGFRVGTSDIRARAESCVYSVTNRETFRSIGKNQVIGMNIPKLIKLVWRLPLLMNVIGTRSRLLAVTPAADICDNLALSPSHPDARRGLCRCQAIACDGRHEL